MGQLFSREVSVLASFDYVDFDNAPGTDLNTPRFWEGDPSESTLPTPKYVRSPNVTVRDIRGQESEFEFSKDGFQLLAFPSAHVAHPDNQEDTQAYLQETAARVRNLLNASQAFVFDYRFRVNKPRPADRQHHQKNSPGFVGRKKPDAPFTKPHVDHTEPEAYRRLRRYLSPDEIERHLDGPTKSRFMIVNAWRPLNRPVEDMPLALCEFSSLDLADVASSHFHGGPGYIAETYVLRHNKNHKWVWFGQQHPNELLVFKNFDSKPGEGPRFIPHAAFFNPLAKPDAMPRESIECRMIVIIEEESSTETVDANHHTDEL
ncbi:hypothetical protein NKR19_g4146 [Coniochaeta hoffmannii]|uniref:CmcJ-like methyltransferase n=1 Tax=Coniochaeta hoffmannii TaxID=91930 RepID=A0AA38RRI7_9PEZI|nr:hypothetical protein NKR19_g4146 [Coniochaeta hoffmannii]